ncbi:hypothetical protein TRFO_03049 [Tritrichomonas foetus]|uniref:Uncharacterized protein n=1 Tax=Tritrichomonas foetus TaxID=1144522 RepID=A0A1J4KV47_9EUKA|nr:hypothetical protein TRFO_03049 [Tritrichomonas foetus]|eukprot:OHT14768.1 hypothetical protein TRFO_03049 [Tritrichomonas foetus]
MNQEKKVLCIKKIEIHYSKPTLFHGPQIERVNFHSLKAYFDIKNQSVPDFLDDFQKILDMTYIPYWSFLLLVIFSLGLLTWTVIQWQDIKTVKAAKRLTQKVQKWNDKLKNEDDKFFWKFEIPLPSKDGVLLHACYMIHES